MQLNGGALATKRYPKNDFQGMEAVGLWILGNEKRRGVVSAVQKSAAGCPLEADTPAHHNQQRKMVPQYPLAGRQQVGRSAICAPGEKIGRGANISWGS